MQKPIRCESCIKFDTLPTYCRTQQEEEETAAVAVSLPTFGISAIGRGRNLYE